MLEKDKKMYICNGLNVNCPKECYIKTHHEYDNILDTETRCGYPGSDKQFDLVRGVVI